MKRALAILIVVVCVTGVLRGSGMVSMSMHGHDMGCESGLCAASTLPAMPSAECLDHCLQAARTPAATSVAVAFFAIAAIAAAFVASRSVVRDLAPTGGPPSIGPSLRLAALHGIVMLN